MSPPFHTHSNRPKITQLKVANACALPTRAGLLPSVDSPWPPCFLKTHTQGASFAGCTASHLAGSFLQHTHSEHLPCTSRHSGKCWTHRPQWKRQKLQAAPRKALQSFPLTTENTLSVLLRFFTFWK